MGEDIEQLSAFDGIVIVYFFNNVNCLSRQGCLLIEGRPLATVCTVFSYARVCSFGFDLDPMTLIYELDIPFLKTYSRTRNEVSKSKLSKVRARTGHTQRERHTHRQVRPNALPQPHSRD